MEVKTENEIIYCVCNTCGSAFEVSTTRYGSRRRPRNYCSYKCRPSAQKRTISSGRASRAVTPQIIDTSCPACGVVFSKDAWKQANKKYCSTDCRNKTALDREKKYRAKELSRFRSCQTCGTSFEITQGNPTYCKPECRQSFIRNRRAPARILMCRICEQTFVYKGGGIPKDCSRECADTTRFVVANPNCNPLEVLKLIKRRNAAVFCDVCKQPPVQAKDGRMSFHIDHDHVTGRMRGVLCHSCNVMEGLAQGSPERLRMLAAWIETAVD